MHVGLTLVASRAGKHGLQPDQHISLHRETPGINRFLPALTSVAASEWGWIRHPDWLPRRSSQRRSFSIFLAPPAGVARRTAVVHGGAIGNVRRAASEPRGNTRDDDPRIVANWVTRSWIRPGSLLLWLAPALQTSGIVAPSFREGGGKRRSPSRTELEPALRGREQRIPVRKHLRVGSCKGRNLHQQIALAKEPSLSSRRRGYNEGVEARNGAPKRVRP